MGQSGDSSCHLLFEKGVLFVYFFHSDNATFFNGVFQNVESVALFFGKYVYQLCLSMEQKSCGVCFYIY